MSKTQVKMIDDSFAVIQMPENWSDQTLDDLWEQLTKAESAADGIVISGMTENFCVGITAEADKAAIVAKTKSVVEKIKSLEKPVVACTYGSALGVGYEVAQACDEVMSVPEKLDLRYNAVKLGLPPMTSVVIDEAMAIYELAQTPASLDMVPQFKGLINKICFAKPAKMEELSVDEKEVLVTSAIEKLSKKAIGKATKPSYKASYSGLGTTGLAALDIMLLNMLHGDFINDDTYQFAKEIAAMISGGDIPRGTPVTAEMITALQTTILDKATV